MQVILRGFIFRIIFTAIGFLVSLLIAKLAGADQFGTLSLMIVNAAFIYIITGLGTDAAIVWHGITGKNYDRNKIFSFTLITTLIQLLFFYIIAILGYIFLGHTLLGGGHGLNIFFAEVIYFTGLVVAEKFSSLYYSQHEAKLCNRILAIVSLLLFVAILVLWIVNPALIEEESVWIYSLFVFFPSFILLLSYLFMYKPSISKISEEEYRSFSSFSVIVMITNTIQFIAYRADYWLISIYYDHEVVGVYAQATKFAQLLWIIPGILAGLITPALKNERDQLSEAELLSITRLSFYLHLAMSILIVIVAWLIYTFFLPQEYFNGIYSLLLMLPGYLFFIITLILAAFFSANRLLVINLYGSIICCVLIVAFDMILIPKFSYVGAAIANLVAYSVSAFYTINRAMAILKIPLTEFFVIRRKDFIILSFRIFKPGTDKA